MPRSALIRREAEFCKRAQKPPSPLRLQPAEARKFNRGGGQCLENPQFDGYANRLRPPEADKVA